MKKDLIYNESEGFTDLGLKLLFCLAIGMVKAGLIFVIDRLKKE